MRRRVSRVEAALVIAALVCRLVELWRAQQGGAVAGAGVSTGDADKVLEVAWSPRRCAALPLRRWTGVRGPARAAAAGGGGAFGAGGAGAATAGEVVDGDDKAAPTTVTDEAAAALLDSLMHLWIELVRCAAQRACMRRLAAARLTL